MHSTNTKQWHRFNNSRKDSGRSGMENQFDRCANWSTKGKKSILLYYTCKRYRPVLKSPKQSYIKREVIWGNEHRPVLDSPTDKKECEKGKHITGQIFPCAIYSNHFLLFTICAQDVNVSTLCFNNMWSTILGNLRYSSSIYVCF